MQNLREGAQKIKAMINIIDKKDCKLSVQYRRVADDALVFGFTFASPKKGVCEPMVHRFRGDFPKALKVYLYTITKEKELRRVRKEIHDYIHERCDTL
jgi:hypothetical protein